MRYRLEHVNAFLHIWTHATGISDHPDTISQEPAAEGMADLHGKDPLLYQLLDFHQGISPLNTFQYRGTQHFLQPGETVLIASAPKGRISLNAPGERIEIILTAGAWIRVRLPGRPGIDARKRRETAFVTISVDSTGGLAWLARPHVRGIDVHASASQTTEEPLHATARPFPEDAEEVLTSSLSFEPFLASALQIVGKDISDCPFGNLAQHPAFLELADLFLLIAKQPVPRLAQHAFTWTRNHISLMLDKKQPRFWLWDNMLAVWILEAASLPDLVRLHPRRAEQHLQTANLSKAHTRNKGAIAIWKTGQYAAVDPPLILPGMGNKEGHTFNKSFISELRNSTIVPILDLLVSEIINQRACCSQISVGTAGPISPKCCGTFCGKSTKGVIKCEQQKVRSKRIIASKKPVKHSTTVLITNATPALTIPQDPTCVHIRASDDNDIGISELVGTFLGHEWVGCRRSFRRKFPDDSSLSFQVIYYWDDPIDQDNTDWWFGNDIGGPYAWACNPLPSSFPPLLGWRIPWDAPEGAPCQILLTLDSSSSEGGPTAEQH